MARLRDLSFGKTFGIVAAFLSLLALLATSSGCWDDDCPEGCQPGYACYYGECLSTGYCPLGSPHSSTCAKYDDDGTCLEHVDHAICNRGFVCVCTEPRADGSCGQRECLPATDSTDGGE